MSHSYICDLLEKHRPALLEAWIQEQLASEGMRRDLIKEEDLRADSHEFLLRLHRATENDPPASIKAPQWATVIDLLGEFSRARTRKGFSAAETAIFVFSLKAPLVARMRAQYGQNPERLFEETTRATTLLDALGLYTTEVHQKSREELILRQQEEMLELSTPVVKLWEGIVALPLIGTLDSARTTVVMESLLQRIVETGSEIAIIDITGVPTVDTLVAQHLLKTVAAARLMGADCIISGIRPQIAQTMVHLAIDLSAVTTKSTMAEALRTALQRMGVKLVKAENPEPARRI